MDSVAIELENIFAPGDRGLLPAIGNALHVRTRPFVVRRELLLRAGEPWDSARAAESARNLRALGIFRRALVDSVRAPDGRLVLRVRARDGWSTRPLVDFSSAAGQTAWTAGLLEENLLGTAGSLSVRYRKTPDRESVRGTWVQPRLLARRVNVAALGEWRSDGRILFASVGQPFFAFPSRWSLGADVTDQDGDVLRFRGGDPVPAEVLRRRYTLLRLEGGHALVASPGGYVRAGFTAQLRRDDFVPSPASAPFPRSTTGAAGAWLAWRRARFAVVRNVRSFFREEDEDLSTGVRVAVLASPRGFGYAEGGVGTELGMQGGLFLPGGYVRAALAATGRWTGAGLDSGTAVLNGTLVLQPARRHALVASGFAGWQRDPVPGAEFDLGLSYGPRAFPAHAFTGDRAFLAAAEYRWTVADDALGLAGIALAGFADWGGAWYAGSARRTGTDLGVGLRFGFSRLADPALFRVDLAWRARTDRLAAGWSVVAGRGFTF